MDLNIYFKNNGFNGFDKVCLDMNLTYSITNPYNLILRDNKYGIRVNYLYNNTDNRYIYQSIKSNSIFIIQYLDKFTDLLKILYPIDKYEHSIVHHEYLSSLYVIKSEALENYIYELNGFIKTCISKKGWGTTWNLKLEWIELLNRNIAKRLI